jgi:peptidoglycan/xylan/chitin deacetylase (PgdA/CDA1 family)
MILNSDFGKRRVVIYARVSTEHEAQISALENQLDWYKPILAARPEWELVGQYIDEGITGTSAEKQQENVEMIVAEVMAQVKDGSIILMHELYQNSYLAFCEILKRLDSEGYEFVTVSELLGEKYQTGKKFWSGR